MARCSWTLLFLASATVACSGTPELRTALPAAGGPQVRSARPAIPAPPSFYLTEHIRLRKNAWNPIPLPSGFSGSFYPGSASTVGGGTAAYIVTANADPVQPALPQGTQPLLYASISVGATALLASGTKWRFILPKAYLRNAPYYVGVYDPSNPTAGWQLAYSAKGTVSGSILTIATRAEMVLAPTLQYTFALYAGRVAVRPSPVTAYELVGTLRQHYTFAYPPSPYPSSSPQPPIDVVQAVRQFYVVQPTQPPGPIEPPPASASGIGVHLTEIDKGPRQTTVSSSDSYLYSQHGLTYASGSIAYLFAPESLLPDTTTIVYHRPQLVEVSPSSAPVSWTDAHPRRIVDQVFAGGVTYHRVVNDDGSYKETGTVPLPQGPPQVTTLTELSNGSGSYTNSQQFRNGFCEYAFGTPDPNGKIPIGEYEDYASSQSCGYLYARIKIPAWFPPPPSSLASPSPGPVLVANQNTVYPAAPAPATCRKAAGVSASLSMHTSWELDTIVGYAEIEQSQTYQNAKGATICLLLSDTLQNYYDWLSNNPQSSYAPLFTPNGQPVSTVVTSETLWSPSGTHRAGIGFGAAQAARLQFRAYIEALKTTLLVRRLHE